MKSLNSSGNIGDNRPNSSLEKQDAEQDKKDWIFLHGSNLLKTSLLAGYSVNCRYAQERAQLDYPGFFLPTDISIEKTDSPPAYCLKACAQIAGSYCSHRYFREDEYYLTIDNYLEEHTIVKKIIAPIEIINDEFSLEIEDCHSDFDSYESEKRDWIFSFGSELLQRSIIDNYDSTQRYVEERLAIEYPGFHQVAESDYQRANSPPESCLNACLTENGSYCSQKPFYSDTYYLTIDNYLDKYQIVKKIDLSQKAIIAEPRKLKESKDLVKKFFVMVTSISFVTFGYINLNQTRHSPIVISPKRLAIEEELIFLRATRLNIIPIPYNHNLSSEEQRIEIEKELTSLRLDKSSMDREIELNRKLIKELKSKR